MLKMQKMRKFTSSLHGLLIVAALFLFYSCEDYFNPDQEIYITEDKLLDDWNEYRALEMGLYGLQQNLAEQLLVLGELRADLLTITENADADLVEIYNFLLKFIYLLLKKQIILVNDLVLINYLLIFALRIFRKVK